ncbi:MAG TPA: tetratricopeptide repeat protein, partial [Dongiaceae bacterium]|nr:tetratricopeptide repeat protein [Dongiaceae bacterium]
MKRSCGFDIAQPARRRGTRTGLFVITTMLGLCAARLAWAEVPLPEDQPNSIVQQDEEKNAKPKAKPAPLPEDNLPDDVQSCFSNNDAQMRVVACTHAIEGRQITGDQLSAVYYNRAIGYSTMGQSDAAIRDFGQAIKIQPDVPAAYVNRGIAEMRANQLAPAKQDFDTAIAKDKDNVDAHYMRAWLLSQQGKDNDAIADLGNVLKNHPDHFDALLDRGGLLLRNGKFDPAITDFTAMVK